MTTNGGFDVNPPWQVLDLRVTAFVTQGSEIDGSSLWNQVIGGAPDEEQRRPREGLIRLAGSYEESNLVLQITNGLRVDMFVQPNIQPPPEGIQSPESAKNPVWPELLFPKALETACRLTPSLLRAISSVNRLALGAQLVKPAVDLQGSHKQLARYLPNIDLDGSLDFFYQINRPRESKNVPGTRINRLCKWSVMTQASGGVSVSPGNPTPVQMESLTLRWAGSLGLDINTAPGGETPFPQECLQGLFVELADMGNEIAEKGDIG